MHCLQCSSIDMPTILLVHITVILLSLYLGHITQFMPSWNITITRSGGSTSKDMVTHNVVWKTLPDHGFKGPPHMPCRRRYVNLFAHRQCFRGTSFMAHSLSREVYRDNFCGVTYTRVGQVLFSPLET